ncbi:hypothetical protein WISP_58541 [Willisornis vidua]|uniref:Uncharacterized protein n=1 Tax=Willisornis vidua TaxID=1566151 RepID=A0ABQ9DBW9_9PASS|nr:hypothetical protein WISP_58541 [Willisornis vidua]
MNLKLQYQVFDSPGRPARDADVTLAQYLTGIIKLSRRPDQQAEEVDKLQVPDKRRNLGEHTEILGVYLLDNGKLYCSNIPSVTQMGNPRSNLSVLLGRSTGSLSPPEENYPMHTPFICQANDFCSHIFTLSPALYSIQRFQEDAKPKKKLNNDENDYKLYFTWICSTGLFRKEKEVCAMDVSKLPSTSMKDKDETEEAGFS